MPYSLSPAAQSMFPTSWRRATFEADASGCGLPEALLRALAEVISDTAMSKAEKRRKAAIAIDLYLDDEERKTPKKGATTVGADGIGVKGLAAAQEAASPSKGKGTRVTEAAPIGTPPRPKLSLDVMLVAFDKSSPNNRPTAPRRVEEAAPVKGLPPLTVDVMADRLDNPNGPWWTW